MTPLLKVAVVGANTLLGETLIPLLEERQFPVEQLFPLVEAEAAGGRVEFKGSHLRVEAWEHFDFAKVQLAFFCASADVAHALASKATAAGCLVIDQSPAFRQDPDVPLVVPEINRELLREIPKKIVASPSCAAIALAIALKPLHDAVGIDQVEITTLQAVSGRGKEGVEELASQTVALLNMRSVEPKLFSKQIAFNLYPQIESLEANGYSGEEMKIVRELRRLLGEHELPVHVTAVRVPVFYGHSAAVRVVLRRPFTVEQASAALGKSAGIAMLEDPNDQPTPVTEAAGKDVVWLGRLRQDLDDPHALAFWVVTDNLRKGGALNVLEAAEIVKKGYLDV